MINQFVENFKKTEFYTNHKLQAGILASGTILGLLTKFAPPAIHDNLVIIMVCLVTIFIPIGILAIYDGIMD